jgi:beta-glucosidase
MPQLKANMAAALFLVAVAGSSVAVGGAAAQTQPMLQARTVSVLTVDGLRFKDLDRSGMLDPYEDWRLSADIRAQDLVRHMTLAEKAAVMMHGTLPMQAGNAFYDVPKARGIIESGVNSLITRLSAEPRAFAEQSNQLQAIAEQTRLGIPLTISTDPRHHFQVITGATESSIGFSQWPELIGFAALDDTNLMRRFADVARQEYRAIGINMALSPQADLATEPRWSRINATFGEDPQVAKRMVGTYVEGMQGGRNGLNTDSVITVVKHWAGYGAARDGLDSHNAYGRFAVFPGGAFASHLVPFEGAFAANVAGVMPTYSVLIGAGSNPEKVGGGYNRWLLQTQLRERFGFKGMVLSDWAITNDCGDICRDGFPPGEAPGPRGFSTAWGVEHLSRAERFAKGVEAGIDQFGGTEDFPSLVEAVQKGYVPEAKIDESARRILTQKFALGLFENPYVDIERAARTVGNPGVVREGIEAQQRALVLLENRQSLLPLRRAGQKLYLHGISADVARSHGFDVVDTPEVADLAIIRTEAPYETLYPQYWFGSRQHDGSLAFSDDNADLRAIRAAAAKVPTIVTVYLDRPAILTNVRPHAAALLVNFGVSDGTLFDVLTGRGRPRGKLPFELPSSMDEVDMQAEDLPHDTAHPLYRIGYGLAYR